MTNSTAGRAKAPELPNSEEFSQTLGQVSWLCTLSKDHRTRQIGFLEHHVITPLMFKQVRVYTKGKQPLGALIWAYVSPEVKAKIEAGDYTMGLNDWRSGSEIVIVDCISPFVDGQMFIDQFQTQIAQLRADKT